MLRYVICIMLSALAIWLFKTAAALFLAAYRLSGAVSAEKADAVDPMPTVDPMSTGNNVPVDSSEVAIFKNDLFTVTERSWSRH